MIDDKIRFECYNEIALRDKAIKYQDKLYSSEKLSEKEGIKTRKKHIKNKSRVENKRKEAKKELIAL